MRRYCFASVNVDASEVDADDVGDANAGNASVALPPLPREVRSKIGRDCISNVIMQCHSITRVMIFLCDDDDDASENILDENIVDANENMI